MTRSLLLVMLLALAMPIAAQNNGLTPPGENASLPDLQTWLLTTIKEFSTVRLRRATSSEKWQIPEAHFDGCKFEFTAKWEFKGSRWVSPPAAGGRDVVVGTAAGTSTAAPVYAPGPIMDPSTRPQSARSGNSSTKTVTIDLKDIGAAGVYPTAPVVLKDAFMVHFKAKENAGAVVITENRSKTFQGFADLMVRKEAAIPIRDVFLRVIKLCEADR
jgi:hypothetical protein